MIVTAAIWGAFSICQVLGHTLHTQCHAVVTTSRGDHACFVDEEPSAQRSEKFVHVRGCAQVTAQPAVPPTRSGRTLVFPLVCKTLEK